MANRCVVPSSERSAMPHCIPTDADHRELEQAMRLPIRPRPVGYGPSVYADMAGNAKVLRATMGHTGAILVLMAGSWRL
jgi:hypothetical protein